MRLYKIEQSWRAEDGRTEWFHCYIAAEAIDKAPAAAIAEHGLAEDRRISIELADTPFSIVQPPLTATIP